MVADANTGHLRVNRLEPIQPNQSMFFSWLTSPLTLDLSFEARSCDALHPLPCENEVELGNTTTIFADLHFKS